MDPSNPRDRDLIKIAAAVASTLWDRDDLESVSVAEPSLSEEEIDRLLPDVRRVKLSDRPPLQMRSPSSYRRALDRLAHEKNESLNHLVSDYVREGAGPGSGPDQGGIVVVDHTPAKTYPAAPEAQR
jgi:hypothetical protein